MPSSVPTAEQKRALEWIAIDHASATQCFILAGYAGTGKTYLIGQLVAQLKAAGRPFILMAPTGRAAKVMSTRTGVAAHTIHKQIYAMDHLKEYLQQDVDGSETYKFYFDLKNNGDDARTVYIVDESSMVSDVYSEGEFFRFGSGYLLRDLLKYINFDNNDHDKKIIFVGDPAQLPPVGSNESPALKSEYLFSQCGIRAESFEMTDVVRHREGSGILVNATTIRNAIRDCRLNVLDIETEKPDVQSVAYDEVVARYASLGGARPPEKAIIIAYSNRLVNDYNRDIRARYFTGVIGPVAEDRLLVVANNHKGDVSLLNGDLVRLVSAAPSVISRAVTLRTKQKDRIVETKVHLIFRDVEIEINEGQGHVYRFATTILENLLDSPERDLSSDEQKALYVDFKIRNPTLKPDSALFKDALRTDKYFNALRVKYGYAMTCHKAQGGEWSHVFVDFAHSGGVFNSAYFRWAYTAITRAKEVLFTINAPHFSAITLSGKAGAELSSYKVRDDLLVLGPEVIENEAVNSMVMASPFLKRLFLAVSSLLESKAIAIEKVESFRYCEHYHFRRGEERAVFLFYYNAQEVVTSALPSAPGGGSLQAELTDALGILEKKYIVLEADIPVNQAERGPDVAVLSCEHSYMMDAYALLLNCAHGDGIAVIEVKAMGPYHLYGVFARGGHKVAIDYHFDGKGRLTRALPRQQATTSADLMQQILGYSAGS